MMVIVPRIAVVSHFAATPFIYGIQHEGNLGAELLLSSVSETIRRFSAREADIALLPAVVVPSLSDCKVVSDYCIGLNDPIGLPLLVSNEAPTAVKRLFVDLENDPVAARLAVWAFEKHWKTKLEYIAFTDRAEALHPAAGDAYLLTTDSEVAAYAAHFAHKVDLVAEWRRYMHSPLVLAVWVAHKETDPDLIERLQYALTFGLEHSYEALIEANNPDPAAAYSCLSQYDCLFDDEKNRALEKFWDLGLKIAPRTNPG